jgi:hypothetical protein
MTGQLDPPGDQPRPQTRSQDDVLRDLERERAGLVEAIDNLKLETQAAKDRLRSYRTPILAGAAVVVVLMLLRGLWRRRSGR